MAVEDQRERGGETPPPDARSSTSTLKPGSLHSEPLNTPTPDNSTSEKLDGKDEDEDTVDLTGQGVRINRDNRHPFVSAWVPYRPDIGREIEIFALLGIWGLSFFMQATYNSEDGTIDTDRRGMEPYYPIYLTHWAGTLNGSVALFALIAYALESYAALQSNIPVREALIALEEGRPLSAEQEELLREATHAWAHQLAGFLSKLFRFFDNPAMAMSFLIMALWGLLLAENSNNVLLDSGQHIFPWVVEFVGLQCGIQYAHTNAHYLVNLSMGLAYLLFTVLYVLKFDGVTETGQSPIYTAFDPNKLKSFATMSVGCLAFLTALTTLPHPLDALKNGLGMLRSCCQGFLNATNTFTTWLGWGGSSPQTNSLLSVNQDNQYQYQSPLLSSSDMHRESPDIRLPSDSEENENVSNTPEAKTPQAEDSQPRTGQKGYWNSLCSNLPSFTFWRKATTDNKGYQSPTPPPTMTEDGRRSPASTTLPVPQHYPEDLADNSGDMMGVETEHGPPT